MGRVTLGIECSFVLHLGQASAVLYKISKEVEDEIFSNLCLFLIIFAQCLINLPNNTESCMVTISLKLAEIG